MKIIPEFPNYRIYENGKIESNFKFKTNIPCDTWREVKPILDKGIGYLIVTLCDGKGKRKNKRVHRLLAQAYIPNPENKAHINHIDGNKQNNCLSNLEWNTPKENTKHAIRTGLCDQRRKAQEVAIVQMDLIGNPIQEHVSLHEAGRSTGIAWQNISKVCRGLRNTAGGFKWEYKKRSETIPNGSTLQA